MLKQGIFGSSFNFDNTTQALITAANFGVFWVITLPLTLAVLASYSMWPSLRATFPTQGWSGQLYFRGEMQLELKLLLQV